MKPYTETTSNSRLINLSLAFLSFTVLLPCSYFIITFIILYANEIDALNQVYLAYSLFGMLLIFGVYWLIKRLK